MATASTTTAAVLDQNVSNPFNPNTEISYSVAVPGDVTLDIYNVAGQKARELVQEGAQQAMSVIPNCGPFKLELPITGRLQLKDTEAIDKIVGQGRSQRVDEYTVERTIDDPRDVYRF